MAENTRASRLAWVVAGAAVIVFLFPALGYAQTSADVVIVGHEKRCAAVPPEVRADPGGAVCFTNEFDDTVELRFTEPVLFGTELVTEIPVPPKKTRCINRDPNSTTAEIPYAVFVEGKECTDPSARPKIIIN